MHLAWLVFATVVACSSPPKPAPPANQPTTPDAPPAREVIAAQYAAELASVLEAVAAASCACKDDGCKQRHGLLVMTWLRDMGAANDMDPSPANVEPCWKARASAAFQRANTGDCVSAVPPTSCPAVPRPVYARVDPWWKAAPPCPGNGALELVQLPGAATPVSASCRDGNGQLGRHTQWHPNGSVLIDGAYDAEHRRHGRWRAYYLHGVLAWERTYDGGEIHGEVRTWAADGAAKTQGGMRHGKKFGPWMAWDERGERTTTYYEDDAEITASQWESTGAKKLCAADCIGAAHVQRTVEYSVSAEKNYTKGTAALAAKQYEAAALYLMFVRSRFPYSKYTPLAEQELTSASAEYTRLRAACVQACGRCEASCRLDATLAEGCRTTCSVRFPDGANLPPRGS